MDPSIVPEKPGSEPHIHSVRCREWRNESSKKCIARAELVRFQDGQNFALRTVLEWAGDVAIDAARLAQKNS